MNALKNLLLLMVGGRGGFDWPAEIGLLIARVSLGFYMAAGHGWGKVPPSAGFIGYTEKLGFPAPELMAWGAGINEFFVAIMLMLGLFTRPAAIGLVFTMGVAAFVAHGSDPFVAAPGEPSKEMAMLYLIPFLMFAFTGSGRTGLDSVIRSMLAKTGYREPGQTERGFAVNQG
jgi:putative oxidoreductase